MGLAGAEREGWHGEVSWWRARLSLLDVKLQDIFIIYDRKFLSLSIFTEGLMSSRDAVL